MAVGRVGGLRGAIVLLSLIALAATACGDDEEGDLVIRRNPNPTTATTLDREALGLNTDVSCAKKGAFSLDEWAETATNEERAEADALLRDRTLSDFFIHATEAQTRQACELFDGVIIEHDG